ncbi:MAG TPA: TetR/AcrR family transcriptional regulator [Terriglobales bacterium]|nr:TetR/AcrR family transcriptional regulator [Terriglobales bacterium]
MKKKSSPESGRPRSFNINVALDTALRLFREKGYEGTSLSDLTKAMGINRPSLYAAFGDKRALFENALQRYSDFYHVYLREALQQETGRAVAEHLLLNSARLLADPQNPRGCLFVQGALACGEGAESVRQELINHRGKVEKEIRRRLKRAKADGDLPPTASPADLAAFLASVMYGMSVRAASGKSRAELKRVAETALQAWPK